ncbi:hypothetical protein B0H66DRAFT_640714 [Apodospora peruviana]|uniref:Uncharacterized protein n=1 Tax=Apodospora peruviana TaxID=516989 RepID=A0AAE0HZD8_9PEZI|nr:hypothetical protein B0H66DRAFT_640714 [Apodospora peruviana]
MPVRRGPEAAISSIRDRPRPGAHVLIARSPLDLICRNAIYIRPVLQIPKDGVPHLLDLQHPNGIELPSMLSSLFAPALLLFGARQATVVDADYCTTPPSWTIANFKSNTSDTVGSGGSASFTLINDLSGASDQLSCALQVNYRCIIAGTPSDKNLTVHVAIRTGSLTLILDEELRDCPGRTSPNDRPLHVIGTGDLELDCIWDDRGIGGSVACTLEKDTVQGEAVELAPG